MAFIFVASSVPGDQLPGHIWDKFAHLAVYAVLGMCFLLPLSRGRWSGVTAATSLGAVALSLLYGISDELHQGLTPGRTPDVMDLVADTLGAALGVAFVLLIATFAVSRSSRPAR